MNYLILKGETIVNRIVADENFIKNYCEENGYTYTEVIREPSVETDPEPTTEERVTALEEQYAAIEDALCEMDAANSASIAAIEDALCEMDKEG